MYIGAISHMYREYKGAISIHSSDPSYSSRPPWHTSVFKGLLSFQAKAQLSRLIGAVTAAQLALTESAGRRFSKQGDPDLHRP